MKRIYTPLLLAALAVSMVWASGCATVLTHTYPPVTEIKKGGSLPGDKIGFTYAVSQERENLILMKQPLCRENIEMTEVKKKQLHGVLGAVIEIPFFGLGILDLVTAGVYSRATMEEIPRDPVPGPTVSPCGDFDPAPDMPIVIQYPDSISTKRLRTSETGAIRLADIRPDSQTDTRLTIFVREQDGLHYVKSIEKNAW